MSVSCVRISIYLKLYEQRAIAISRTYAATLLMGVMVGYAPRFTPYITSVGDKHLPRQSHLQIRKF